VSAANSVLAPLGRRVDGNQRRRARIPVTGKAELFEAESPKKEANAAGVVVWLEPLAGAPAVTRLTNSSEAQGLRLVQEHKSFHPRLLVVEVGASVEFPNHDPFFHNVFLCSKESTLTWDSMRPALATWCILIGRG